MLRRIRVAVTMGMLLFASQQANALGITISHDAIGCIQAGRFPQFFARFDPSDAVSRAQLYFRPTGWPHWYFVPMKQQGDKFVGVLPKPEKSLAKIEYYISVSDRNFGESRSEEYSPAVVNGPAACQQKKILAAALPHAQLVLVSPPEGVAGLPKVPVGFSNDGVVGVGSAASSMAAGASAGAATAGGGIGTTTLVLGGIAAAGAVTAGVVVATRDDPAARDDDGDGFSEKAGDCNDNDRSINPNGGVVTSNTLVNGAVSCATPLPPESVTFRNLSCQSLSVTAVVGNLAGCTGVLTLRPSNFVPSTLTPGFEAVVFTRVRSGSGGFAGCCTDVNNQGVACNQPAAGTADPTPCTVSTDWVFSTSAGAVSVAQSYSFDFFDCPACPSVSAARLDGCAPPAQPHEVP